MPRIYIRTGSLDKDGNEEVLAEYFCDTPDCGNVATQVLGVIRELRAMAIVCDDCYRKIIAKRR